MTLRSSNAGHEKSTDGDRQFVTALSRGLAILRCFDANRVELSVSELAQLTGLPQPTAWRLCYTLQRLGYLVQAPRSDRLRVGLGVLGLGQFALVGNDIPELLHPEMQQLADRSRAAVSLCVVEQENVLILRRAVGQGPLLINLQQGSRLSILTSSGGWAYLSALSAASRDARLSELKPGYAGKWPALRAALDAAISEGKSRGFVLNSGFFHKDVNAVGAAITDAAGAVRYVLTCGGPDLERKTLLNEFGPKIAEMAKDASRVIRSLPV